MASSCLASSHSSSNPLLNITEILQQRWDDSPKDNRERLELCWGYSDCGDCHRSKGHCGWCAIVCYQLFKFQLSQMRFQLEKCSVALRQPHSLHKRTMSDQCLPPTSNHLMYHSRPHVSPYLSTLSRARSLSFPQSVTNSSAPPALSASSCALLVSAARFPPSPS